MLFCDNQMLSFEKNLSRRHPQAGLPARFFGKLTHVEDKPLAKWQTQLARTQAELAQLGPMRPGSLSQQYKDSVEKTGSIRQAAASHDAMG